MKKTFQKGAGLKIFVAFLLSLIVGYAITGLLRFLNSGGTLNTLLLDFKGTFTFLMETDQRSQLLVAILSIVFFGWFLSKMRLRTNSYEDAHDFGVHGSARFTKPADVLNGKYFSEKNRYQTKQPEKTLQQLENGLIVGKVPDKKQLMIIPRTTEIDNRNVYIVGSSGSGKGQSYVIPNLINNREETLIVTDPKGELFEQTATIKRKQGYKVYQIDFINFNQDNYNLLDYVFDDQDAQSVSVTIAKNSTKDGKEDFFMERAQKMLAGLIVYCKTEITNASMQDVLNTFNEHVAPDEESFRNWVDEDLGPHHPAYQLLKGLTTLGGNTRTSVTSSFASQVSIFTLKKISEMTRTSDFNFREFQEQKSILYVKLPMDENPFTALTSVFFDQLIAQFYKMADENRGKLKIPTIFLLDEFPNIGKIDKYGRVLATCRGLGLSMNTIVQDNGQIESLYGKEMARSILSNHDALLFLRSKDMETIKYFSQLAGETTAKVQTGSSSQSGGFMSGKSSSSQSTSEQYVKRSLISEGDLASIAKNDCYLFVSGLYPLKLQKAWQSEVFGDYVERHTASEPVLSAVKKEAAFIKPPVPQVMDTGTNVNGGRSVHIIEEEIDQSDLFDLTDEGLEEEWEEQQQKKDSLSVEERLKEHEATDLRTLL